MDETEAKVFEIMQAYEGDRKKISYDDILYNCLIRNNISEEFLKYNFPTARDFETLNKWLWEKYSYNKKIIEDFYSSILDEKIRLISLRLIDIIFADNKEIPSIMKKRIITEIITKFIEREFKIYTIYVDKTKSEKNEMWFYDEKEGIYKPSGYKIIREITRKILGGNYVKSIVDEVIAKVEADTFITSDRFFSRDNNPYLIVVENGILDLKNKKLLPFSPDYFIFNKIPVKYDPEQKPVKILEFFKSVLKDEEDLMLMQEIFGFVLVREYFIEKAFLFTGKGRNGKSKTLELLKRFVGAENCSSVPLQTFKENDFAKSTLFKKMVNLAGDIPSKKIDDDADFKALTGRDLIHADRKFLNPITFVNYAKLIFSANEVPYFSKDSEAFFSRWIMIKFPFTFVDKDIYEKLKQELPEEELKYYKIKNPNIIEEIVSPDEMSGLLNWALEGLQRLLKNKRFTKNPFWDEVKKEWMRNSNSFLAFLEECVIYKDENSYNYYLEQQSLVNAYERYCFKYNLKKLDIKTINKLLKSKNIEKKRRRCILTNKKIFFLENCKFNDKVIKEKIKEKNQSELSDNLDNSYNEKFVYFECFIDECDDDKQKNEEINDFVGDKEDNEINLSMISKSKKILLNMYKEFKKEGLSEPLLPEIGVIDLFKKELNIKEDKAKELLDEMKKIGDIYEPKPGFIDLIF